MSQRPFPELAELAQWMRAAEDLDEALLTLASALAAAGFAPVHCALIAIEPNTTFKIAGIWVAVPSQLGSGWIINALATDDMRRHADQVLSGRPVRVVLAYDDMGIFGDIARAEGVRAFLAAPVTNADGVSAVVFVSSSDLSAVQRIDLSLVHALGHAIGSTLIAKMPPTTEVG